MARPRQTTNDIESNGSDDGPIARLRRAAADAELLKHRIEEALERETFPILRRSTRAGRE